MADEKLALITQEQLDTVLIGYMGKDDSTEEKARQIARWADTVLLNYALLENVLAGNAIICDIEDGEPSFMMTEEGSIAVRKMLRDD